jgi:tRNA (cmo5U34)-methyltransferase
MVAEMSTPLNNKSTPAEIAARFDKDVDRFSNLESGQTATMDAPLAMELITQASIRCTHPIRKILDVGCGAGNNTLKLLQQVGPLDCDLLDLSGTMLQRAKQRVSEINAGEINIFQGDFRTVALQQQAYDVILAAAVLHHLRDDADWEHAFSKLYNLTAPGGSLWITDLVSQETQVVEDMMWDRYADYLVSLGGKAYRDKVFAYIDKEDSPRPVTYQMALLRKVGFSQVELLHKQGCFAAFGALKSK